ncbi:MAG: NAD(P)/FAD-dependent oxidoreductase [Thermodesulfobacteriota bacterium]
MEKLIEIAGAGPAGIVAAINLVKAGYDVTVYEENSEPGHRFHGDFQGIENWSSLEDAADLLKRIGIAVNPGKGFIFQPYRKVIVFDPSMSMTVVKSEKPFFYLVERGTGAGSLDEMLLAACADAGVKVVFNKKVDMLKNGGIVGTGPKAADAIAKGIIFNTTMEDTAAVILDDGLAPKGYAYLLVHGGKGTIATCMFKEFKKEKECFERTLHSFGKAFPFLDIKDSKEFGGYGNFFFGKPAFENNRYYVGEAAGLQDCLWGFGMRYAMVSGYLAARSITEGVDYASLLKKELLPMQRTSLVNRFLFERLGNKGYAYLVSAFDNANPVEKLRRHYNPSFLKTMLYPIAAWRHKSRLIYKGCHGKDCVCVWCRCGNKENACE